MRKRVILSIVTLILGIIIYYLFSKTILVKDNIVISFIRNYLLDGLWIISFYFIAVNFSKNITKYYKFLTSLYVIVLGIVFEVMQLLAIVGGTFDFIDILVYAFAALISCLVEKYIMEEKNEKV